MEPDVHQDSVSYCRPCFISKIVFGADFESGGEIDLGFKVYDNDEDCFLGSFPRAEEDSE